MATLNEMINGVINSFKTENSYDWQKISGIKIGVYPAGSGNDFARNIEDSSLKKLKQNIINH